MKFPYLQPIKTKKQTVDTFGGYRRGERATAGEWAQMSNLSSRKFPLASPRLPRGEVQQVVPLGQSGLIAKSCLWMVNQGALTGVNPQTGEKVHTFQGVFQEPPQLVSFSSYILDMKGGRWFSTLPDEQGGYDFGQFAYSLVGKGQCFGVYLCDEQGKAIEVNHFGTSMPQELVGGLLWLDTTDGVGVLKRYYEDSASFAPEPCYLKISMDALMEDVEIGDTVEITLPAVMDDQGNRYEVKGISQPKTILQRGVNNDGTCFVVVRGELTGCSGYWYREGELSVYLDITKKEGFSVENTLCAIVNQPPLMDYLVEAGNRLWGCRFGTNKKGEQVNEIYASALGSFRVWEKFEGLADDSYALSCGTDGPFTGGAVYAGNPIFFKETCMHRVYGTFPFSVTPMVCNGVKQGCAGTLATVNNRLFYLSPAGICVYSGATPVLLDFPLLEEGVPCTKGVGSGNQTHYYLALQTGENQWEQFVYNTQKGLLMKEEAMETHSMACLGEEVFALVSTPKGNRVVCLTGSSPQFPPMETQVSWYAQTGLLGMDKQGKQNVRGLELALTLPAGSTLGVQVQYNGKGPWHSLATLEGEGVRRFTLPLRLMRCQCFALRFFGKGDFTLHALSTLLQEGGNPPCI